MIQVENVDLAYPGGPVVLRGLNFRLAAGSFHFLTGKSGAGKTTLLRALYLDHRPESGAIRMFGEDIATLPHEALPALRRRIGVVFQDFRLLDHLTVAQNVGLPLTVAGIVADKRDRNVAELLDWVGLGDKAGTYPPRLSGGEKQQVAIARAVIGNPSILLADEPTGNVDAEIGGRLMWLLAQLNRQGTTTLIATHDQTLLRDYATQAGVLHLDGKGGVVQQPIMSAHLSATVS